MATCTLRIGDRVALSSVGAAPEVEYALFDPGEIDLAATGPGMVQEIGYQTTAEDAINRLKDAGITWALVLETASAAQPTLAMTYARGSAVRRVAVALGAAELFDGFTYDTTAKVYQGRWLDLPALALDTEVARLTHSLQAMHLLAMLREVAPTDVVRLSTREIMAQARPGQRSFRRCSFPAIAMLPTTLRAFAVQLRNSPRVDRVERDGGPSAQEMLETLRDRIVLLPDPESQDRLRAIEKAIGIRQQAMRGPLADAELWPLEEQLSAGRAEGVTEIIDSLEKTRGKQPATTYLRMRAALVAAREPPRVIAERISSLALSMPSFVELELLATEAWNAAGEPKRALPFARDLISNASVNNELRARESQQFAARRPSQIAAPAVKPPLSVPDLQQPPRKSAPARTIAKPSTVDEGAGRPSSVPATSEAPRTPSVNERLTLNPGPSSAPVTPPVPILGRAEVATEQEARRTTQPLQTAVAEDVVSTAPHAAESTSVAPTLPAKPRPGPPPLPAQARGVPSPPLSRPRTPAVQPASSRRETPPMMFGVTEPAGRPKTSPGPVPTARSPLSASKRPISGTWVGPPPPRTGQAGAVSRPTEAHFGAVPPPPPPSERPPAEQSSVERPPHSLPKMGTVNATNRPTSRPAAEVPRLANRNSTELMRGASQPPFRSDSPDAHVHVPRAAPLPRFDDGAEAASALSLPEGLNGVPEPIETLPRTVLDARVQFTFLARELGREYDEQLGIVLRADISGIEEVQRVLLERYKTRSVTTPEGAADVRRHGAFVSEVLARSFSAFWVDIGPSDVGYWAMVVPPGTRVWPFGRILRLIAMQHNERDLVSYFLELQGRANAGH